MERSRPDEQEALIPGAGASSLIFTLGRGLNYIRQERYVEGIALLALAREQLSADQVYLSAALEAFIEGHTLYWRAQQALHHASQRFAEAVTGQQTRLTTLHNLLAALVEDKESTSQSQTGAAAQALKDPQQYQAQEPSADDQPLPALYITCFGHFEVRRLGQPISLCPSRSGQSILRYLVAQPGHCATMDTLMAMLWPEDESEVAQPRLHSAISALRRSLNHGYICGPGSGYIVCKNRVYYLNPSVVIRTDVDEFLRCYQAERQTSEERVALYEKACRLYTGPFLPEDMYADWSFLQREQLNQTYLAMCRVLADYYLKTKCYDDATKWATAVLQVNHCDEEAHRQLIQVYAAQGHRSEALQQYRRCECLLREELGVAPLPETTHVFQKLLISETSSTDTAKMQ